MWSDPGFRRVTTEAEWEMDHRLERKKLLQEENWPQVGTEKEGAAWCLEASQSLRRPP